MEYVYIYVYLYLKINLQILLYWNSLEWKMQFDFLSLNSQRRVVQLEKMCVVHFI